MYVEYMEYPRYFLKLDKMFIIYVKEIVIFPTFDPSIVGYNRLEYLKYICLVILSKQSLASQVMQKPNTIYNAQTVYFYLLRSLFRMRKKEFKPQHWNRRVSRYVYQVAFNFTINYTTDYSYQSS